MITRLFRPFRDGVIGFLRHFSVVLSSVSVVTFTMIFLSAILLLASNINTMTKTLETEIDVWFSIEPDYDQKLSDIETEIKAMDGILSVTALTKDQELDKYIEENGPQYAYLQGKDNPLLNAFVVQAKSGDDLFQIVETLKTKPWLHDIRDGGQGASNLITILNGLRIGGTILIVSLAILTIFLINNTIKLSIVSRQDEIEIMRIVGATNHFIRSPFLIEGVLIGLVGSLLPILLVVVGYPYLLSSLAGTSFMAIFTPSPAYPLVLDIALILLLLSMSIGLLGSYLAVSRHLRWVR